jgi:excisionase family DNA binding protein
MNSMISRAQGREPARKRAKRKGRVQAADLYRTMPLGADVLTSRELALYLHVHLSTVYRLLRRQQIPAFKIGSDWRFNMKQIDWWTKNGGADGLEAVSISAGNGSSGDATARRQKVPTENNA